MNGFNLEHYCVQVNVLQIKLSFLSKLNTQTTHAHIMMKFYKAFDNMYVGRLPDFKKNQLPEHEKQKVNTIFIIDRSGSMNGFVQQIVTKVIPKILSQLDYFP